MTEDVREVRIEPPSFYFPSIPFTPGQWVQLADLINEPEVIRISKERTYDGYPVHLLTEKTVVDMLLAIHKIACKSSYPLFIAHIRDAVIREIEPIDSPQLFSSKRADYYKPWSIECIFDACQVTTDRSHQAKDLEIDTEGAVIWYRHDGEWDYEEPTWGLKLYSPNKDILLWNEHDSWVKEHHGTLEKMRLKKGMKLRGERKEPMGLDKKGLMHLEGMEGTLSHVYIFIPNSDGLGIINSAFRVALSPLKVWDYEKKEWITQEGA